MEDIPDSMLAAQIVEFNQPYKIHHVPTPKQLREYDLLIKIAVASLCHTDFMVSAGALGSALPLTASHEGAGTVVAVGSSVTRFRRGDRVLAGLIYNRCQHCTACIGPKNGHQYCQKAEGALGIRRDGSFAEYEIIDSREACILPPNLSFASAAPLACAGSTVWTGIQRANLSPGQWIAIIGSGGGLGHLAIQFAKALGLKTIGIDARDEALELSRQVGADVTIDARQETAKVIEEVMKATEGVRADATLNLSNADSAAGLSCAVTKNHGLMIQIAQPPQVSVPFIELIFRDITIQGSLLSSRADSQNMLDLMSKHKIHVKTNAFYGIHSIPKLIEFAHSGKMAGKGVVIIDEKVVSKEQEDING